MSHVFISYVREDQELVARVCNDLSSSGIIIWRDVENLSPGVRYKDSIRRAIKSSRAFIAFFSKSYMSRDSSYMNEELVLAIETFRQKGSDKVWFIPIVCSDGEVPDRSIGGGETFLDLQWVDLRTNYECRIESLKMALGVETLAQEKKNIDKLGRDFNYELKERPAREIPRQQRHYYLAEAGMLYNEARARLKSKFGIEYNPIDLGYPYDREKFEKAKECLEEYNRGLIENRESFTKEIKEGNQM